MHGSGEFKRNESPVNVLKFPRSIAVDVMMHKLVNSHGYMYKSHSAMLTFCNLRFSVTIIYG